MVHSTIKGIFTRKNNQEQTASHFPNEKGKETTIHYTLQKIPRVQSNGCIADNNIKVLKSEYFAEISLFSLDKSSLFCYTVITLMNPLF